MAAPNNLLPASHIRHNYSPGDTGLQEGSLFYPLLVFGFGHDVNDVIL